LNSNGSDESEAVALRVLIFDSSGRGGIALYTAHLANQLAALGIDVRVSGIAGQSRLAPELPVRPWWEPSTGGRLWFYVKQVKELAVSAVAFLRVVRAVEPDIIHVQTSIARWLDPVVMRWSRRRCPVVLTVHDPVPLDGDAREGHLERRRWSAADGLIVHERRGADIVGRHVPGVPVFVIPADLTGGPTHLDRRLARQRLNWPPLTPTVLMLGLIRPYKGLDLLAAAWPQVMAIYPQSRLIVAGPQTDDVPGVEDLRHQVGVDVRIGWLSDEEVDLWAAAADLFLLPYTKASHSGVLHRAVANATPVLASPALSEEVELYRAGRILTLDPQIWAEGIMDVLYVNPLPSPVQSPERESAALATTDVYRELIRRQGAPPIR
jgi:glycosyltransferase involved in cell wall biosynthesis